MKKYKIAACVGTVIMGIGSFMACLASNPAVINTGNVLLVISMVIMGYGFSTWQP